MSKKLIFACSALAALVVAVVAFFVLRGPGKDSYCSVIPENALMVARLSPSELLLKNGLDIKDLVDNSGMKGADKKKLSQFLKCGVDFTSPFYFFMDENANVGVAFGMDDAKDLKNFLEDELDMDVDDDEGFYTVEVDRSACLCFSDDKGLFFGSTQGRVDMDDALDLMDQKAEESILETKLYEQLIGSRKSAAMNINYGNFLDAVSRFANSSEREAMGMVSAVMPDCNMLMTLDIDGSEAMFTTDIYPNTDKAKKDLDKMMEAYPAIEGTLAEVGLKNPLAWCTFNFPGPKVMDLIKQVPGIENVLREIEQEIDLNTLLGSFDGDVSLALNNNLDSPEPEVLLVATTKNNKYVKVIEELTNKGDGVKMVSDGGNDFHLVRKSYSYIYFDEVDTLGYDDDYDFDDDYYDYDDEDYYEPEPDLIYDEEETEETLAYVANKDGKMILTNAESLKNSGTKSSSALEDYKSELKGSSFFGFVNVKEILKQAKKNSVSGSQGSKALKIWDDAKDLTLTVKKTHAEMVFRMDNDTKIFSKILESIKLMSR